jgi:outer membrane protein assembly factor BamA
MLLRASSLLLHSLLVLPWLCAGCASIPEGRYGVRQIEWRGVEQMSSDALEACLATKQRDAFELRLGLGGSDCGVLPFDEHAPRLRLFSWPWTTWPAYDAAIFAVDRQRVLRWYQARGFYQARIASVRYSADGEAVPSPERCRGESCALTLHIEIDEGPDVHVETVTLESDQPLPPELDERLRKALAMRVDERLDEAIYEADKARLRTVLKEESYAKSEVEGHIDIDRNRGRASVVYQVRPGPACRFGGMRVEGNGKLDAALIMDSAGIARGAPYRDSVIRDAEQAIYALGTFSSVRIENESQADSSQIDLVIRVRPGRLQSFRIGVGMMSGSLQSGTSDEVVSVPEWDVHLRAIYRNQDFLGGMRKLTIEDRPRLIFLDNFPWVPPAGPKLGNTISLNFEQPRFIEHRTVFFTLAAWDLGPDPFYGYFRHDVTTKLGVRRRFFRQVLSVELAVGHDFYQIISSAYPSTVSSYRLPFLAQDIRLDLRDNAHRPRKGLYLATAVQEAVRLPGYGSWDYVRVLPEARAYQHLPWKLVLAERVAFGALFVLDRDPELDPTSSALGPQSYRLRGGGANSNRGFLPGTLGDGVRGGKRRWESSVELRVPLSTDLELGLFFDVGDVSQGNRMRLDDLNAATGFGLRYFTAFAPIRLDLGWRIPGLQTVRGEETHVELGALPSAVHLTIGEAF